MRKNLYLLLLMLVTFFCCQAQQLKHPSVLVIPGDNWMSAHGFMKEGTSVGRTKYVPLYAKALAESEEIGRVLQMLQGHFADRGIGCYDLATEINTYVTDLNSENQLETLVKSVKPDFVVEIDYSVRGFSKKDSYGPKNISWKLAATYVTKNELVASLENRIKVTLDVADVALQKAITAKGEEFVMHLFRYYLDTKGK